MIRTALCFSYSPAKLQKHYGKGRHGYHPSNLHQKWKTITLLQFSTAPLAVPVMVSDWDAIWLLVWCNLHSLQACLVKWDATQCFELSSDSVYVCRRRPADPGHRRGDGPGRPEGDVLGQGRSAAVVPDEDRWVRRDHWAPINEHWSPPLGPDHWALITSCTQSVTLTHSLT